MGMINSVTPGGHGRAPDSTRVEANTTGNFPPKEVTKFPILVIARVDFVHMCEHRMWSCWFVNPLKTTHSSDCI